MTWWRPGLPIFVVANWDRYDKIPFIDACAYVALSAYFPLVEAAAPTDLGTTPNSAPNTPPNKPIDTSIDTSVDALIRGWRKWREPLIAYARRVNRPLYFAELGYSSIVTAASTPWDYSGTAPQDLNLQARLFEALTQAWAQTPELHRIMIWSLRPSADPHNDKGFDVFGKPAEQAVRSLFKANPS